MEIVSTNSLFDKAGICYYCCFLLFQIFLLTLWRPAGFGDFQKKTPKRMWLAQEFLQSGMFYRPGLKVSKDAASLLVSTRKKFFAWGVQLFCE